MPATRAEAQARRADRRARRAARRDGGTGEQLALPPGGAYYPPLPTDAYPYPPLPAPRYPPVPGPVDSLPDVPAPPPTLRTLWKRHGPVIAPPLWFAATEVIALALPYL